MTAHPSRTLGPVALLLCTFWERPESPGAEALALCRHAAMLEGRAREDEITMAIAAAESAIDAAADSADAHFALFCALGLQIQDLAVTLGVLGPLRRALAAVDRALALDPDHVAAMVGKGAALIATPCLAGGDPARGLLLLQQALERDPGNPVALRWLVDATGREGLSAVYA